MDCHSRVVAGNKREGHGAIIMCQRGTSYLNWGGGSNHTHLKAVLNHFKYSEVSKPYPMSETHSGVPITS